MDRGITLSLHPFSCLFYEDVNAITDFLAQLSPLGSGFHSVLGPGTKFQGQQQRSSPDSFFMSNRNQLGKPLGVEKAKNLDSAHAARSRNSIPLGLLLSPYQRAVKTEFHQPVLESFEEFRVAVRNAGFGACNRSIAGQTI